MRRRRTGTATSVAGVALAAVLASAGAAGAADATGWTGAEAASAVRASPVAQDAPALEIVSPPQIVKGDEPFVLRVDVDGAPDDAILDVVVYDGLDSRGAFRETLEGDLGATRLDPPAQPLAELAAPGGTAEIELVPGEVGLSRNVYPVEVQLWTPGGDQLARVVTYLPYVPDDTPEFSPLQVAVLVDIAEPPALQPDGETVLSPAAIDRALQRVEAVEQAGGARVTLAPLPETLEALARDEGDGAGAVERLAGLANRNRVLARPFVDVDYGALQAAGLTNAPSEANEQAEGGADVVRDRLGVEPMGGVWLSGATWGETSAELAAQLSIGRAVVPPSAVVDGESNNLRYNPIGLGERGPTAMISDPGLAAHLTGTDGMVAAHRFVAELAITWLEAPSNPRAVVVHLPPDGDVDPEVVGAALAGLGDGQVTATVPLTQVFADTPPAEDGPGSLPLTSDAAGPDLSGIARDVRSARRQVSGVGSLLGDPRDGAQLNHSLLLATGTATPDDERQAYVDRVAAGIGDLDGAVTLPPEFRITLTARTSSIPVRLTNHVDETVDVRVELESDQLEFVEGSVIDGCDLSLQVPEGAVVTCTLPPGTTSVDVPVRARTSGAFTMDVRVLSEDGALELDRSTFDVRSTAISGVGLILSVGAGLFLAVWWARNWHKSRRRRDDEPVPGGDATPPGGGPTEGGPGSSDPVADPAPAGQSSRSRLAPWATASRPPSPGPAQAAPPAVPPPAELTPTAPPPPPSAPPRSIDLRAPGAGHGAASGDDRPPREDADDEADDTYRPAHMASSGRRRPGGLSLRSSAAHARRR